MILVSSSKKTHESTNDVSEKELENIGCGELELEALIEVTLSEI